ncbi:MAG TPA: ATP-binding protein, partial [Ktedonobacteraceae bacterium]|nr:ATP-binding protein [Ktedonobacteraceae bacterium]
MPFIRKTETKQAQMVTDARNLFIGRSDEIQFFVDHILRPEEPLHNMVSLYGQGGVGKTTLLGRFIEEAHAISMKNNCLTARVDEQQSSLTSMMERFAEQLGIKGEFEKAAAHYKESLRKLRAERELAHDTIGRKATTAITKSLSKGVPIVGDVLEQGTSFAVDFMWDEIQYRQRMKDEKRLENPIRDLTKAFVKELNERAKSHHRLIFCFDTFERLAQDVAPWLLDYFLPADLNGNIVLVVAGRDPIERSLPDDPKRWLSYIDQGVIHQIELKSFTEEETRKYLMERGISDDDRIVQIWQLSRGLPLYLGLLTANPQGQIDPTADVVKNFLRWIPEQEQTKRKVVLDIALLSRPFNRDELKAFSYISDEERPELYNWLLMQPFVRRNMEDGRCSYHEVAQELFSRHLYTLSSDEYYTTCYALVEYYRGVLIRLEEVEGKEVYKSPQWLELRLALAYQLLLLPDEVSHIKAIEEVFYALVHGKWKETVS